MSGSNKMTLRQQVAEVRKLIDTPEKWIKTEYRKGGGKFCLVGAIFEVKRMFDLWMNHPSDLYQHINRFANLGSLRNLSRWNDLPDTTHADVMDVLDRAEAAA